MTAASTTDVFDLVIARPVIDRFGLETSLVHLWWSAPQIDERLVQVYVNGELIDTTPKPDQNEMWLLVDRAIPARIELLAVNPPVVSMNTPSHLQHTEAWLPVVEDTAAVRLLRDENLPLDTQIIVSVDETAMDRGPLWPADEPRSGFGALLGEGAFGFDSATGPGLGVGELGMGPLGSGGSTWRWRRDDLDSGEHQLRIEARDSSDRSVGDPFTAEVITIERLADPPSQLNVTNEFKLVWSD